MCSQRQISWLYSSRRIGYLIVYFRVRYGSGDVWRKRFHKDNSMVKDALIMRSWLFAEDCVMVFYGKWCWILLPHMNEMASALASGGRRFAFGRGSEAIPIYPLRRSVHERPAARPWLALWGHCARPISGLFPEHGCNPGPSAYISWPWPAITASAG